LKKRALIIGLTHVDPKHYNGWSGHCPGCDLDAKRMRRLAMESGIDDTIMLLNSQAKVQTVKESALMLIKDMHKDDLLFLYASGHGNQQPDQSGDEEDNMDESLCLWDGELIDDVIGQFLLKVPIDIRIFMITDTCHSGSNFRGRSIARATQYLFPRCKVIHYGGCNDGEYSYGSSDGGVFTNALLKVKSGKSDKPWIRFIKWFVDHKRFKDNINDLTYYNWVLKAQDYMAKNGKGPNEARQVPSYAEYGEVSGQFRDLPIFK
jgi:hypothetical protein